jgi:hypothetical protein
VLLLPVEVFEGYGRDVRGLIDLRVWVGEIHWACVHWGTRKELAVGGRVRRRGGGLIINARRRRR